MPVTRRSTRSQSLASTASSAASASETDDETSGKASAKKARTATGNARNGRRAAGKQVQNGSKMTVNRAIKGRRASAKDVAEFQPSSKDNDEAEEIESVASQDAEDSESIANSEEDEEDLTFALPPPLAGSSAAPLDVQEGQVEDGEEEEDDDDDDDGTSTPRQNGAVTLEDLASFAQAGLARLLDKTDHNLSQDEEHMLEEYAQRVKAYQAVYPLQSSQDSQVVPMLFSKTVIAPSRASRQIIAWTRLVNLLMFHGTLCLTLGDVDEQMVASLLLLESALLSEFVPRSIRTSPEILNLFVEMKCQVIIKFRQLQQIQKNDAELLGLEEHRITIKGGEQERFEVNADQLEKLFGNHKDAQIAVETLRTNCKAAWKKLETTTLDKLLEEHLYERFINQAVEVIDRCTRISKAETQDESPEPGRTASAEVAAPLKARKTLIPPNRKVTPSDDAEPNRSSPRSKVTKALPAARAARTARKVSSEKPALLSSQDSLKESNSNGHSQTIDNDSNHSESEDEVERSFRMRTVRKKAESERRFSESRRKAQASLSSPIKNKLGDRLLQVLSPIRREKIVVKHVAANGPRRQGQDDSQNGQGSNSMDTQSSKDAINALKGTPGDEEGLDLDSDVERALNGETSQESDGEEDNTVIAANSTEQDVFIHIDTIMQSEDEVLERKDQPETQDDDQSESQYKQTFDPEDVEAALLGSPSQRPLDGPLRSQASSSVSKASGQGRKAIQPLSESEEESEDIDEEDEAPSDVSEKHPKPINGVYRGLAIGKDNRIVQRDENTSRVSKSMLDRQPDAKRISMSSPSTQTQTQRNSPVASRSARHSSAEQRRSMSIPVVEVATKSSKAKGKQRERSTTAEAPSAAQPLFYPEPADDNLNSGPNDFDLGEGDHYPLDEEQDEREEQNDIELTNMEAYVQATQPKRQEGNPVSSVRKSNDRDKQSKSRPWPAKSSNNTEANSEQEAEAQKPPLASSSRIRQKQKEKATAFRSSSEEDELAENTAGRPESDVNTDDEMDRKMKAYAEKLKAEKAALRQASRSASKRQPWDLSKQKRREVEIRPEQRDPERVAQKDRHKGDSARQPQQAKRQQTIRRPPTPDDDDEEVPEAGPSSRPYDPSRKRKRKAVQVSDAEDEAPSATDRSKGKGKGKTHNKRNARQYSESDESDDFVASDSDSDGASERLLDRIWKKYGRELLGHRLNDLGPQSEGEPKRRKSKIVPPPKVDGQYARVKNGVVLKPKEKYYYSSSKKHGRMPWTAEEDLILLYGLKKLSDPHALTRWKIIIDQYGRYGTKHLRHRTAGNCKDRARTIQNQREKAGLERLPWYAEPGAKANKKQRKDDNGEDSN